MTERSLSRVADRVGLSQPGVSHALQRLRRLTGDPLFERHRDGMRPTPRALALAEPVSVALARLQRALIREEAFDPRIARRIFSVAASDGAAMLLLPSLIKYLRKEAPGVDLRMPARGLGEGLELILSGEVDLGVGVYPNLPQGLSSIALAATRLVCVADADHPRLVGGLDRAAFTDLPHVAVADGRDRGANIDAVLASAGLDRRVMVDIPHFLLAPRLVVGTDLLAVVPEQVLHALRPEGVRVHPLPVETNLVTGRMVWRERYDEDKAHAWFRGLVATYF